MKKIIALILTAFVMSAIFAGCAQKKAESADESSDTVRLGGLKGATSIGMVKLLDDAENKLTSNNYEFTMAASADELTPKLLKGELDIIAVPANLGSVLYNNSNGAVQTLAVNTLGVVYIAEKGGDSVKTISDLKGQTVYASGKGSTPEYTLKYLLEENGLDAEKDVTVEWKNEPTEVVAQISAMDHAIALIPQPFATVAQNQLDDLHIALDLTNEWDSLDNGSQCITASLIVRTDFAKENPDMVKKFLEEYRKSTNYVNENVSDAAQLVEKYDIIKAAVAEKAIPFCNIVCITGNEMKTSLSGYLEILFEQNAAAVGGKLPNDDFYLIYE